MRVEGAQIQIRESTVFKKKCFIPTIVFFIPHTVSYFPSCNINWERLLAKRAQSVTLGEAAGVNE